MEKAPEAFRTISEVAEDLDVPKHVLRFWEGKFSQLRPLKRGGGRRYYRPEDIDLLRGIRQLLYGDGYTIKGVQRLLREQGVRFVMTCWKETAEGAPGAAVKTIPDVASDARSASGNAGGNKAEKRTASMEGLSKQQADRLRSVLTELEQCKKMLNAAKN